MRRVLIFASSLLFLPAFAAAQHHGGIAFASRPIVAAPHAVAPHVVATPVRVGGGPYTGVRVQARTQAGSGTHTQTRIMTRSAAHPRVMSRLVGHARVTTRSARQVSGSGFRTTHHRNGVTSDDEFFEDEGTTFQQNVPGLGFDFPHLAAINGGRRHEDGGFFPFGFNGFLLSSPGVITEEPAPVEQQPVAETAAGSANDIEREHALEGRERRPHIEEERALAAGNAAPPAPQHDAPEYVFVKRDGGLVFAVAYSWDNGTLRYITHNGLRGSVIRGALDLDATQQFNEQRGLDFRSPA
jgi:hypothetical protein